VYTVHNEVWPAGQVAVGLTKNLCLILDLPLSGSLESLFAVYDGPSRGTDVAELESLKALQVAEAEESQLLRNKYSEIMFLLNLVSVICCLSIVFSFNVQSNIRARHFKSGVSSLQV
jgi:hypothetical protein